MPRELKLICWTTREGTQIPVRDMTDSHLVNTVALLISDSERRYKAALRDASVFDDFYPEPQWFDHPMLDTLKKYAEARGIDVG